MRFVSGKYLLVALLALSIPVVTGCDDAGDDDMTMGMGGAGGEGAAGGTGGDAWLTRTCGDCAERSPPAGSITRVDERLRLSLLLSCDAPFGSRSKLVICLEMRRRCGC